MLPARGEGQLLGLAQANRFFERITLQPCFWGGIAMGRLKVELVRLDLDRMAAASGQPGGDTAPLGRIVGAQ